MTDIDAVAEAIRDAHNEVVFGESNEEAWRRLAQAAVDALRRTLPCSCLRDCVGSKAGHHDLCAKSAFWPGELSGPLHGKEKQQ